MQSHSYEIPKKSQSIPAGAGTDSGIQPTVTRMHTGRVIVSSWFKNNKSQITIEAAEHFLIVYSFLIKLGETITVQDFLTQVSENFEMDVRRLVEMSAFLLCTCGDLGYMKRFAAFNEMLTLKTLDMVDNKRES